MLAKLAQEIAKETSEIIGYNVIITDEKGIVIGSCDESRIGTLHEASINVIRMQRHESHNLDVAKMYRGVKPGITFPLQLAGRIVGSIGVSMVGEYNTLYKYGMLVKKQTEIMLREEVFLKSSILREQAIQNLIQEITVFDDNSNETLLLTRGQELGYDLKPPHIPIVIDLFKFSRITKKIHADENYESPELVIQMMKLDAINTIKSIFSHKDDITNPVSEDKFIVLHILGNSYNQDQVYAEVQSKCEEIISRIENHGFSATIGIGTIANDLSQLADSYRESWQALIIGKRLRDTQKIFFIKDLHIEELLTSINKGIKKRFLDMTLKKLLVQSDELELLKTIKAWCECGFSPIKASKELNIHRNTLLYRIDKIEQICGIDLRDFKTALSLYLSVLLRELTS